MADHKLTNYPFTYLRENFTLSYCFLGDTERRVAFYDMESDAYEEDDNSDYMWEGESLSWVVCSNYKDRFIETSWALSKPFHYSWNCRDIIPGTEKQEQFIILT